MGPVFSNAFYLSHGTPDMLLDALESVLEGR